jgi:cold-inducible RNA-binding protein
MSGKIYVGNLPWSTTSSDLEALFSPHGAVRSAEVISDRETGRSRGFGFVEMETNEGLQAAIAALNGHEINGRPLTVNEARERTPRPGGGGGRPGGGRGYGGGGGGGGYRGGDRY